MSAPPPRWHTPAAAAWGFAEATLFFVVPDVLLGWIALHGLRRGLLATVAAVAGALVGAALLLAAPEAAAALVARVPGIPDAMVAQVGRAVAEHGVWSMLLGPLDGIPFKVYVTQLGLAGAPAWLVLLVAIPARLERFLVVVAVCALIGHLVRGPIARRPRLALAIYLGVWVVQYAFYAWMVSRRYGGA